MGKAESGVTVYKRRVLGARCSVHGQL